jgi:Domain of unknown function (DUF4160)
MPTIAIFNGIIIQMFFEDHDPPHVYAIYSGAKALVRISDGEVIPRSASQEAGELGKTLGETQACRVEGELALCANGRPLLPNRRPQ